MRRELGSGERTEIFNFFRLAARTDERERTRYAGSVRSLTHSLGSLSTHSPLLASFLASFLPSPLPFSPPL